MWSCNCCKATFEEPVREPPDKYHDSQTVHLVCPCCGDDDVEELPNCGKCGEPIYPGECSYDRMCPDCFQAYVLDLLKTSPALVADALGIEMEVK